MGYHEPVLCQRWIVSWSVEIVQSVQWLQIFIPGSVPAGVFLFVGDMFCCAAANAGAGGSAVG